MIHYRLFFILTATLLFTSQFVSGQSIEQRERSAAVFSEILPLPKGFELKAEDVRQLKASDYIDLLQQDKRFSSKAIDELISQTVPNDLHNWRAVIADFSQQCQENIYFAVLSPEDPTEIILYAYFPPGNTCESLYLALTEAGLIRPFYDPSGTISYTEYKPCIRKHCVESPVSNCCFNIIQEWPLAKDCPPDICAQGSDCDCSKTLSWEDLFMEK